MLFKQTETSMYREKPERGSRTKKNKDKKKK